MAGFGFLPSVCLAAAPCHRGGGGGGEWCLKGGLNYIYMGQIKWKKKVVNAFVDFGPLDFVQN